MLPCQPPCRRSALHAHSHRGCYETRWWTEDHHRLFWHEQHLLQRQNHCPTSWDAPQNYFRRVARWSLNKITPEFCWPECIETSTIIPVPKGSTEKSLKDNHTVALIPIVTKWFKEITLAPLRALCWAPFPFTMLTCDGSTQSINCHVVKTQLWDDALTKPNAVLEIFGGERSSAQRNIGQLCTG